MNIYVSNISYTATDEALQEAFAVHGAVESARIIRDRLSGRSRGFGFVEMPNEEEGRKAVEALGGTDLMGRAISVREARPKEEGSANGNGGNGGNGQPGQPGQNGQGGQNNGGRNRNNRENRDNRDNNRENGNGGNQPRPEKPKEPEIVIIQRGMY